MKSKILNVETLMSISTTETNRCGYLTKEEAFAHGFTETEWRQYECRVNKLIKFFERDGFDIETLFRIATSKEDGKTYLIDGQGRRMAIKLYNAKHPDNKITEVCVIDHGVLSNAEIVKRIKKFNQGGTGWTTHNHRHSQATEKGGAVKEAFEFVQKYQDSLTELLGYAVAYYTPNFVIYGERGSHMTARGYEYFTSNNFEPFYEARMTQYYRFLENTIYHEGKRRTKKAIKKLSGQSFAIGILGAFNALALRAQELNKNNAEKAIEEGNKWIKELTDALINAFKYSDDGRLITQIESATIIGGKCNADCVLKKLLKLRSNNAIIRYLSVA